GDALEKLGVFGGEYEIYAGAQHRQRAAFGMKRPLMGRGVDAPRAAADNGDADVGQLKGQFAGNLDAVMGGQTRADHGDGVLVFGQEGALDVKDQRRVVNLLEQFRVVFVRLNDD